MQGKRTQDLRFWFTLSLAFAAIYGILGLQQAFSSEYVASGDGMVYVFWLRRFLDPELLSSKDWIADYYQSITPWGYLIFCRLFTTIGIDPLLLTKLLPIVLTIVTTGYCFGICMQILPVPAAGFFSTLMVNQSLWMGVSLATGTPLSFLYPAFTAFLYYLLRRSLLPCLVALVLQGLFYPQYVLLSAGVLILPLIRWKDGRFSLSQDKKDYWFCFTGLGVALLVLLPYLWKSVALGGAISKVQAKTMPEFSAEGRNAFFFQGSPTLKYWFCAWQNGILPHDWCILRSKPSKPPQILFGLLLPIVLLFPSRFPLTRLVTSKVKLLFEIVLASLVLYLAAHVMAPKLYFAGRYTQHSLRIVMAMAAGIALIIIIDAILNWAKQQSRITLTSLCLFLVSCFLVVNFYLPAQYRKKGLALLIVLVIVLALIVILDIVFQKTKQEGESYFSRQFVAWSSTILLSSVIVLYPNLLKLNYFPFPTTDYVTGRFPELYEFFEQQPKDIFIASLAEEANNLPTFAKRSILVGWRFQHPFREKYYTQFRQRSIDLIEAQYSPTLDQVQHFIQKYGVDFWLLEQTAFSSDYFTGGGINHRWLRQFEPATSEAIARLKGGNLPALARVMDSCSVFETDNLVVLDTKCIVKAHPNDLEEAENISSKKY